MQEALTLREESKELWVFYGDTAAISVISCVAHNTSSKLQSEKAEKITCKKAAKKKRKSQLSCSVSAEQVRWLRAVHHGHTEGLKRPHPADPAPGDPCEQQQEVGFLCSEQSEGAGSRKLICIYLNESVTQNDSASYAKTPRWNQRLINKEFVRHLTDVNPAAELIDEANHFILISYQLKAAPNQSNQPRN